MMKETRTELAVGRRQVLGKKVKGLRHGGLTPANIFGRGLESEAIEVPTLDLKLTLQRIGRNDVIYLLVDGGEARPTLVRSVQRHPLSDQLLHVDFQQISLAERVRVDVPIMLTGRSEAVETLGGTLLASLDHITVEALPTKVPSQIEVDVGVLETLESAIHVSDLPDTADIEIISDPELVIATVAPPRVDEEAVAVEEEDAVDLVESQEEVEDSEGD